MSWQQLLKDEDFLKGLAYKYKGMIEFINGEVIVEPAPAVAMEYNKDKAAYGRTDEHAMFMALFMEAKTPKNYRVAISIMETEKDLYTGQFSMNGKTLVVVPEVGDKEIDDWLENILRFCHSQQNERRW